VTFNIGAPQVPCPGCGLETQLHPGEPGSLGQPGLAQQSAAGVRLSPHAAIFPRFPFPEMTLQSQESENTLQRTLISSC
jgi:hypothetical protein